MHCYAKWIFCLHLSSTTIFLLEKQRKKNYNSKRNKQNIKQIHACMSVVKNLFWCKGVKGGKNKSREERQGQVKRGISDRMNRGKWILQYIQRWNSV